MLWLDAAGVEEARQLGASGPDAWSFYGWYGAKMDARLEQP